MASTPTSANWWWKEGACGIFTSASLDDGWRDIHCHFGAIWERNTKFYHDPGTENNICLCNFIIHFTGNPHCSLLPNSSWPLPKYANLNLGWWTWWTGERPVWLCSCLEMENYGCLFSTLIKKKNWDISLFCSWFTFFFQYCRNCIAQIWTQWIWF